MRIDEKEIKEITRKGKNKLGVLEKTLERQKWLLFLLGAAVFLAGIGFAVVKRDKDNQGNNKDKGVVFETERREGIIGSEVFNKPEGPIFVDVGGAVERPGVYELGSGARVKDALAAAGGLAKDADREYVSKNMNLAAPIVDGTKVYVLEIGEIGERGEIGGANTININTAGAGELEKLKGIGEVRAKAIIDNRPYSSVGELKSKGVLGEKMFENIKEQISVY